MNFRNDFVAQTFDFWLTFEGNLVVSSFEPIVSYIIDVYNLFIRTEFFDSIIIEFVGFVEDVRKIIWELSLCGFQYNVKYTEINNGNC